MKQYLYKSENFNSSQWTGGTTTELAIYPQRSKYLERNFLWRLSSATVETEESDFSKLPDYQRVLMVLKGEVVLSHEGHRVVKLKTLEQDSFDGAWKTKSFGKITDFNLMVRKGCEGYVDLLYPQEESQDQEFEKNTGFSNATHALYCKEGYLVVSAGNKTTMVQEGQLLVLEFGGEKESYSVMGEGVTIRSKIFYEEMEEELGPIEIPEEKPTWDDFKLCVYLANVQFRWAKYIVKSLKTTWFDEALSSKIKMLEKFFLTSIVFFVGFAVCLGLLLEFQADGTAIVVCLAGWTLMDCLLISPLIYFPFMPKPIRKHIKNIHQLTPYEERVRQEELGSNVRLEKILKKYKNSGKNLGEE